MYTLNRFIRNTYLVKSICLERRYVGLKLRKQPTFSNFAVTLVKPTVWHFKILHYYIQVYTHNMPKYTFKLCTICNYEYTNKTWTLYITIQT